MLYYKSKYSYDIILRSFDFYVFDFKIWLFYVIYGVSDIFCNSSIGFLIPHVAFCFLFILPVYYIILTVFQINNIIF